MPKRDYDEDDDNDQLDQDHYDALIQIIARRRNHITSVPH